MTDLSVIKKHGSARKPLYGVGINDADYMVKPIVNGSRVLCPYYQVWKDMIVRCYSEKYQAKKPTYIGCLVCDDWFLFSNFRLWMIKQDWKGKRLDKDILIQGNKTYSPETCLFVTHEINSLLNTNDRNRGELPIGVTHHKSSGRVQAKISTRLGRVHLGTFDDHKEAHEVYKIAKYAYIAEIANEQTNEKLKMALLAYVIK